MLEELANIVGYHMAAMVSGNNQPDMSGDPRNRIQPARRRAFDDACRSTAEALLAAFQPEGKAEAVAVKTVDEVG